MTYPKSPFFCWFFSSGETRTTARQTTRSPNERRRRCFGCCARNSTWKRRRRTSTNDFIMTSVIIIGYGSGHPRSGEDHSTLFAKPNAKSGQNLLNITKNWLPTFFSEILKSR
ncbi:hypothetical protein T492DRAFT_174247 [Pavlovales sp. CCMP2436]|nr:hypothetical protein T492DRAFT_174247 [Pavlovales sp. CCMP2436]